MKKLLGSKGAKLRTLGRNAALFFKVAGLTNVPLVTDGSRVLLKLAEGYLTSDTSVTYLVFFVEIGLCRCKKESIMK